MDVKKIVVMSLSCANFNDEELNRIMQDKTSRKSFLHLIDCYKTDDVPKKLECIMNKVVTRACQKENTELFHCLQDKPAGGEVKKCYVQVIKSQRCATEQLNNLLTVAKGIN